MSIYPIKALISNICIISNKLLILMFIYPICVYMQLILVCPNEEIHGFGALPLRSFV